MAKENYAVLYGYRLRLYKCIAPRSRSDAKKGEAQGGSLKEYKLAKKHKGSRANFWGVYVWTTWSAINGQHRKRASRHPEATLVGSYLAPRRERRRGCRSSASRQQPRES